MRVSFDSNLEAHVGESTENDVDVDMIRDQRYFAWK